MTVNDNNEAADTPLRVVVISAGVSDPSTTRMLADRIVTGVREAIATDERSVAFRYIELRDLAVDIAQAGIGALRSSRLDEAIGTVAEADGVIVVSPVFKASFTGLFKSFLDVLDDDVLLNMPVILAATAGTPRHALVPDQTMRPIFAYLRALPVPTAVFAATEDWGKTDALKPRVDRAAGEFAALVTANIRSSVLQRQSGSYQRTFDGAADRSGSMAELDFNSDLMRLAAGGAASLQSHPRE
ncbi:FMN reductase [Micrococcales bacterium KH10]|nr:FMN reductase [Micrococcales bacterium KH10]